MSIVISALVITGDDGCTRLLDEAPSSIITGEDLGLIAEALRRTPGERVRITVETIDEDDHG